MTNRRPSHRPSSTSAIGAIFGATDRHEPSHFPWPLESTRQPCPTQLPAGIDQEEGPGVTEPRYRPVSVAAATSPTHVELESSPGKLPGIDLRGPNRSHAAHPHPVADAGTPRVAGLRPASTSARRPASLLGAPTQPTATAQRHGNWTTPSCLFAVYPLGRHLVAHHSGGRC